MSATLIHELIALLPAFLFLATLLLLDSFKLVRPATIGAAVLFGAVAASGCAALHEWLLGHVAISLPAFTRYVSPLSEEAAKILFIAFLFWRRRVGFLVDAAVLGFAVGTGFAIVENMLYLRDLGPHATTLLWVARGLGTAVLHGATTAIAAMLAKMLADRHRAWASLALLPGWLTAVVIHSAYNHLLVSPLVATALLLIVLPLIVMAVFDRSERATREWVGAGLDLDIELLDLVLSEHFQATRLGTYLRELRSRFEGPVVADMFCLLRLELELSVQAKARIMARNAGLEMPVDADLHEALAELDFLRRSIGPTGLLALKPLQVTSERDDWHRYLLSQAGVRAKIKDRLRRKS
jgi:RsiW-degrading membrane proteinase PrsW (M82 family)